MERIIYFSGPHGAGKSSFIEAVAKSRLDKFVLYPDRLVFVKVDEPTIRNRAKYVKYYHEALDQEKFGHENPGKIVLADRCVYDGIVYGRAFTKLGFATTQDQNRNEALGRLLFDSWPQNLVVLNPPLETIIKRLFERWKTKDKKWREENFAYLQAAHKGYLKIDKIFEGKNLLVINQDLSLEQEVAAFMKWHSTFEAEYLNKPTISTSLSKKFAESFMG